MDGRNILSYDNGNNWKILTVDKDRSTHIQVKEKIEGLKFEDKNIIFYEAYTIKEAISILMKEKDMALTLIDIDIDEKDSGLKLISHIRDILEFVDIRIILILEEEYFTFREDELLNYDINGYGKKSRFFYDKIKILIVSALRGYRDIKKIRDNKNTMRNVVTSLTGLNKLRSLDMFLNDSICYLSSVINRCNIDDHKECKVNSFVAIKEKDTDIFTISRASGKYKKSINNTIRNTVNRKNYLRLNDLYENGDHKLFDDIYVAKYKSITEKEAIILIENLGNETYVDNELLDLFYKSISTNFDNLCLNSEIDETQREILYTLGEVTEARSEETGLHIKRVSKYSTILARKYVLSEKEVDLISKASPIHDIGKIAIPDEILQKKGKLTAEEFNIIKTHTTIGYHLLEKTEGDVLKAAAIVAYQHHERYDGRGYPRGLAGDDIHIYGRITAIADVFDALGSERVYKKAWVMGDILNLFKEERGKHFDPELVDILFENLDEFLKVKDKYEDNIRLNQNIL